MEPDLTPVDGLVDGRRAAAMLGVSADVFRVWASRARTASGGIPALMPAPLGSMNGHVYRASDIETFGRSIAQHARGPRTEERSRGAYFTPTPAADFMAAWALRDPRESVLEPSLGDGQFAHAIARRAAAQGWPRPVLYGCEIDATTAAEAVVNGALTPEGLYVGDFLGANDLPQVDVVIGNPPYVRVRECESRQQSTAYQANLAALGEPLDRAGSLWLPFTGKAAGHLRVGGRLAFVLPADFTYVRYARPLWKFLGKNFTSLTVVRVRERLFPGILQNVLLLLADGKGGSTRHVTSFSLETAYELERIKDAPSVKIAIDDLLRGVRSFQEALLPGDAREAMAALRQHTAKASSVVKFNIGYVSGNKRFFQPAPDVRDRFNLPKGSLRPTVATSRQLRNAPLSTSNMSAEEQLWLPGEALTVGEKSYVAHGEAEGVDMAYKCRIRSPWYRVPSVKVPGVVLTTFGDRPRLHVNDAGWCASNSVLGGYLAPGVSPIEFAKRWYAPSTLLSAELEIHSLGGGVMIAVPKEADAVRILSGEAWCENDIDQIDASLRSGSVEGAYAAGNKVVEPIIGADGVWALWAGIERLSEWRRALR